MVSLDLLPFSEGLSDSWNGKLASVSGVSDHRYLMFFLLYV